FVLDQPEEAWFDCNMMQKDMLLALEAGREYGVPMPTTATSNELLTAARGMGLDHYDFAIVFDVLAADAGVQGAAAWGPPGRGCRSRGSSRSRWPSACCASVPSRRRRTSSTSRRRCPA